MAFCRALWRMIVFAILTLALLVGYWIKGIYTPHSMRRALKWRRQWLNTIPRWMGIRLHHSGSAPDAQPVIYLCNHRSYLDPIVISEFVEGVVISKSEVLSWPLIGAGTKASGVLYVKREDKQSRANVLKAMEEVLDSGLSILNFPEGTTAKYPEFLPLRPRTFELAAAKGVPVVPIVLEFTDPDDAWVGNDTFVRHFFQSFGKPHVEIHVVIGTPIADSDPEKLRQLTTAWMTRSLDDLQSRIFLTESSL